MTELEAQKRKKIQKLTYHGEFSHQQGKSTKFLTVCELYPLEGGGVLLTDNTLAALVKGKNKVLIEEEEEEGREK